MKCPRCTADMRPGRLVFKVAFKESFSPGGSYRHLWFAQDGGSAEDLRLVLSDTPREAFCCPNCSTLAIPGDEGARD